MSAASMRSPSLIADSLNVDMSCSVRMVVCAAPARIVRDDTPRWLGAAYSSELASSKARCDRVAGYAALGHTHAIIVRQEDRKSVVSGKSVSVRVDLGGRRILKKKKT